MIKSIFQKSLIKAGKNYKIDRAIPAKLFLSIFLKRGIMLFRGVLFLRKKVFLDRKCSIKNKNNVSFGKNVTIEQNARIDGYASEKIILGDNVRIGAYSLLSCTSHLSKYGKGLKMGSNSSIGDFAHFGAAGGIEIGKDVIMGSCVSFHSENHNFNDTTKLIRNQGVSSKGIKLGHNIWVGAKVTFLDGSVIGNNCVIAAGSVVNGVFGDNIVIGGIPAKVLKKIEYLND
jgi:acetyltransferase-like isoleucine patch superfamily enzyme